MSAHCMSAHRMSVHFADMHFGALHVGALHVGALHVGTFKAKKTFYTASDQGRSRRLHPSASMVSVASLQDACTAFGLRPAFMVPRIVPAHRGTLCRLCGAKVRRRGQT
jgi:hypothetical protein